MPEAQESTKKAQKKYFKSSKGKESRKAYQASEKGQAAHLRYYLSNKGREAREKKKNLRSLLDRYSKFLETHPSGTLKDFQTYLEESK